MTNVLTVNTLAPLSCSSNATISTMMISVSAFLTKATSAAGACPDFILTVVLGGTTVFNDMTNGQCSIPVVVSNVTAG